ncbi:MAG: hypothetical protein AAFN70_12240, partial [Planctomycetota bacterium]
MLCFVVTAGLWEVPRVSATEPNVDAMPEFSAVPRSPQFTDNSALRGYQHLLQNAYVPTDLDDEVFDQIWQVWPDDLKRRAENATPMQRRLMAFQRYGLTPR